MASFEIYGGNRLSGEIIPQGAKNEALQVICATILTSEKVTISNIPDIRDVNKLIELLQLLGVIVTRETAGSYSFQANQVDMSKLNTPEFVQQATSLRGSIMLVGPLLTRFGIATIPHPGGDKIGRRRTDTHYIGFQKLGAEISYDPEKTEVTAPSGGLQGAYILLDEASVTGTANLVMAAVLAKGKTTLFNAACEPYLFQLCTMLNNMGAHISGVGSNLLTIEGVAHLSGCEHRILPDIIEIGSFIGLAAMTRSDITIKNVAKEHLGITPDIFERMGISLVFQDDDIYIPTQDHYRIQRFMDGSIMTVADAPWPGFTPDLISVALVVATQAKGSVLIHQKMFESRLFFVDKLIDMGAQIILCDPHRAVVIGLNHEQPLRATRMTSPDIRAGVALLIAALSAEGKSIIDNIEQIDRGYQSIDKRLQQLGADIRRID
ncbi:UDP-N-acetylglucosamine 1-carboxyvinyltransferase [Microbacter margulisiae]|uniref:UDP-N-acetylglucosamine 1-carboxyvinyltransferase n=1 Tax=Microbacter margulisiae TaxID=1350067 RepID=A0A7W5DPY6_9PORP|nr:UDP-N-acetylglucosamine 1-carboxyvinyltransferase [Microbacter margulisiae]MBB3186927.1 UDP-N-acetylglucosamine 1-carboxyvinyltransferase [Microbacter margulisiae]